MNTTLLRRARELFASDWVDRELMRYNIRAWVKSLRFLGPRWVNRRPVQRIFRGPCK